VLALRPVAAKTAVLDASSAGMMNYQTLRKWRRLPFFAQGEKARDILCALRLWFLNQRALPDIFIKVYIYTPHRAWLISALCKTSLVRLRARDRPYAVSHLNPTWDRGDSVGLTT